MSRVAKKEDVVEKTTEFDREVEIEARRIVKERKSADSDERYKRYYAEFRPTSHLKNLSGFCDTGEFVFVNIAKQIQVKFKLVLESEWLDVQKRLEALEKRS